jgi:release factor glutamine methyltransferase
VITIDAALRAATSRLALASSTPRLDADVLLAHVLGLTRTHVLSSSDRSLSEAEQAAFEAVIARRAALEPIAYIVGHKEFYGLDFAVDQRVLVPRPETEMLVDLALQWAAQQPSDQLLIADIGTGSGCLAVALALNLPTARVFAVDLSADALAVARINVERHDVGSRVTLLQGNGLAPLPQAVALIVSNPPYTVLDEVDANVRRWEPALALDGGAERGFAVPARLLRDMPPFLRAPGAAFVEIGAWQGSVALQTAQAAFPAASVALHRDLAGYDRVVAINVTRLTAEQ